MKFEVTVKTRAKIEEVEEIKSGIYKVSVKEPPIGGRANEAVLRALAAHFNCAPSNVRIVSGFTGRRKIIELIS